MRAPDTDRLQHFLTIIAISDDYPAYMAILLLFF